MGSKNKTVNVKKRRIVCGSVAGALAALFIGFNVAMPIVMTKYGKIINAFLAGDNIDTSSPDSDEALEYADKVVRDSAAESMVLLKNEDYLPYDGLDKVNLFGWGSTEYGFLLTGGGSGGTSITDEKDIKIDLNDAFKAEGIEYNEALYNDYVAFSNFDADYRPTGSTGANAVESLLNPGANFYTSQRMSAAKEFSNVAVAVISRWGAENGGGGELKNIGSYSDGSFLELTAEEKAMFTALESNDFEVIVVLNVCNNVELSFLDDYKSIKACIFAGIPGQSGATAIPQIITGKVNPSGKTSDTLPYDYQTNNPVYPNAAKSGEHLVYQEGIYFGYKWYETADAEGFFKDVKRGEKSGYEAVVQYPFGYGLSYTSFEWDAQFPAETNIKADGEYSVEVTVTNTGLVAGKEVVQLYGHVDYIQGQIERAHRNLLDFGKTRLLQPGESETLTLKYSTYDLASYDEYDLNKNGFCGYEIDGGTNNVEISVQSDAHTVVDSQKYSVTEKIQYANDPVTGKPVVNRFTGDEAYANCPIDGSTAYKNNSFKYLSRANKFANFNGIKQLNAPSNGNAVTNAQNYLYDGYNDKDVSAYSYENDMALYLYQVVDEEGNTSKANYAQLSGEATDFKGEFNKELMTLLNDYDSELWDHFLNQMSQQEIKSLLGNGGFSTSAVESVGKTRCVDKDGPAGFNNNVSQPGKPSVYTLYPSESLLGCSWSKEVGHNLGVAQGKLGKEFGISGWYGPGVNLHRSVYNSRNYEYFSEDATLSGLLAAEVVTGAKENNLYCYIKHMAVSEAGQNPTNLNTWLTEQALREEYLRPFEIAVKKGNANAIMSAFNRVGAILSGYNHAMLTDVLRNEWGFKGSVITDWFTGSGYMGDFTRGILGGNDLWLAGTGTSNVNIDFSKPAVAYAARQSAKNILYTYINTLQEAESVKIVAEAESPLIPLAWTLVDVLLGAGIAVCAVFFGLTFKKNKSVQAENTVAEQTADGEE